MTKFTKLQIVLILLFGVLNSIIFYSLFINLYKNYQEDKEEELVSEDLTLNKVVSYVDQNEYQLAFSELEKITNENPKYSKAYMYWADLYLKYDNTLEAQNVLNKGIVSGVFESEIFIKLGEIKFNNGDFSDAMDVFFLLKEKDPSDLTSLLKYIDCLIILGEDEKLASMLPVLKAFDSSKAIFYYNLLGFSQSLEDTTLLTSNSQVFDTEELLLINKIVNYIDLADSDESKLLALSQVVHELLSNDYLVLAKLFNDKLIDENSFFEKPNLYAGSIYLKLKSPEIAEIHLLRCLKYNPESLSCHILLLESYYQQKKSENIEKDLAMLVDLLSVDKEANAFSLFMILSNYKDYTNLIKYSDSFLNVAPSYQKEINFILLKSAFFLKDSQNMEKYIKNVNKFDYVLDPSEKAVLLASDELLKLNKGEEINLDNTYIIFNLDPSSIFYPLLNYQVYLLYSKLPEPDEDYVNLVQQSKSKALELDFMGEIPISYFNE